MIKCDGLICRDALMTFGPLSGHGEIVPRLRPSRVPTGSVGRTMTAEPSRPPARPVRPVEATAATVPDLLGALREALSGAGPALLPVGAGEAAPRMPAGPGRRAAEEPPTRPRWRCRPRAPPAPARWRCCRRPPCSPRRPPPTTGSAARAAGCWRCRRSTSPGCRCWSARWSRGRRRSSSTSPTASTPAGFAAAARRVTGVRRYTSLVPTQLTRLLAAGGEAADALAGFDAVLVGGAATPRAAARAGPRRRGPAGHHLRHDRDLRRLRLRRRPAGRRRGPDRPDRRRDGRIHLGGPVVARGYLGGPAIPAAARRRPLVPHRRPRHLGRRPAHGRRARGRRRRHRRPQGRAAAGGGGAAAAARAWPRRSSSASRTTSGATRWPRRSSSRPAPAHPTLEAVRAHVAAAVAPHAAPRRLAVVPALPLRGPGKPDRAADRRPASARTRPRPQEGTA